MLRTPVWLAVGLVAGAIGIVALRHTFGTADELSARTAIADPAVDNDYAALVDRVAQLEEQMSRLSFAIDGLAESLAEQLARTDSEDAERTAAIRDIQQRLAVLRPGAGVPGLSPNGQYEGPPSVWVIDQAGNVVVNGGDVRVTGVNGGLLTAAAVAAAAAAGDPLIAPATLSGVQANPGQTLVFRVTGGTEGAVWGSDVYTDDSAIAAAVVHAGLLRPGETGTIMLTVQEGAPAYSASSRNGIESNNYGEWGRSFTMIRLN